MAALTWLKANITSLFLLLVVGVVVVQTARLAAERKALAEAQAQAHAVILDRENRLALADTSRRLLGDSLRALGDSLALTIRKVQQVSQKATALDSALGQVNKANYALTVRIDSLRVLSEAAVVRHSDTLTATFQVEQPPYHVTAGVQLPQIGTGRLDLGITQDPLPIRVKVACGSDLGFGVRPAFVDVLTPKYVTVRLDSLLQTPEVCSPAPISAVSRSVPAVWLILGALIMRVLH